MWCRWRCWHRCSWIICVAALELILLVWLILLMLLLVLLELVLLVESIVVGCFFFSILGIDPLDPVGCVSVDVIAYSKSNDQSCNVADPFQGAIRSLDLGVCQVRNVVSNVDRQEESRCGEDGGHDEFPVRDIGHGSKDCVQN